MEAREITCIVCPVGCRVRVEIDGQDIRISGNLCKRSEQYLRQEVTCPMRAVTSLVAVSGASAPLCPVKTSAPIPRTRIDGVLKALRSTRVEAPVRIGDVLIQNVAETGVDIVATANR